MSSEYKEMTVVVIGGSKAEEKARVQKALMEAAGKGTKLHVKDDAIVHGLSATMIAGMAANSQCKKEPYYISVRNKKQKRQKSR